MLALPGGRVSVVRGGVALVGCGPDLLGRILPLGMGGITRLDSGLACLDRVFACLNGGLAAFEISLAWFRLGVPYESNVIAPAVL
ncbi:hypothetical protein ACVGOW_13140 [Pseudonocardia saturnea]